MIMRCVTLKDDLRCTAAGSTRAVTLSCLPTMDASVGSEKTRP